MNGALEISYVRLGTGYIFILLVLAMAARWKTGRTGEILIATVRMTVQLVAVGYILEFVFNHPSPWLTLLIFGIMETFAVRNVFARVKIKTPRKLTYVIIVSLLTGTMCAAFIFIFGIIGVEPWYTPRYFIPLGGMLIGNSMTGIALGFERLATGMRDNSHKIEAALMLGATTPKAARRYARDAFAAAILPTINSMMGMGIVFLPGMMTGQILSGSSPVLAIRYQIAIMLGILGSVTITVFLMTEFGYRTFFTHDKRLQPEVRKAGESSS
jgi:putative ABC transport system permease protein